jgi:hypothetical protein
MAIEPYFPKRAYMDLSYSDHSRFLRANVRTLQRHGEQLWDSDINNNLSYWTVWMPMSVIYRRDQKHNMRPPFYSPTVQKYIIDPKWANVPDGGEDLIYFYATGMLAALYYKPINGALAWVKADHMLVAYCQDEWKAVAALDVKDRNVEIAIYAKGVKRGNRPYVATHVVGQAFTLPATGPSSFLSRARGIDIRTALILTKNGVKVGEVFQTRTSSGLHSAGVTFNKGDVLGIQIPASGGISDEIIISIIGSLV